MKFLDMIKAANASKNKQAHRVNPGTKAARQLLAKQGNGRGVVVSKSNTTSLRDSKLEQPTITGRTTEPNSSSDI